MVKRRISNSEIRFLSLLLCLAHLMLGHKATKYLEIIDWQNLLMIIYLDIGG